MIDYYVTRIHDNTLPPPVFSPAHCILPPPHPPSPFLSQRRPPPRLYQPPTTPVKYNSSKQQSEEEDLPPTPPMTPPSSQCSTASSDSDRGSDSSSSDGDEDERFPGSRRQATKKKKGQQGATSSSSSSGKPRSILRGASSTSSRSPRSIGERRVRWTAEVDVLEWWKTLTNDMRQAKRAGLQAPGFSGGSRKTPRPWLWQAAGEEEKKKEEGQGEVGAGAVSLPLLPASSDELTSLRSAAALPGAGEGGIRGDGNGGTSAGIDTGTDVNRGTTTPSPVVAAATMSVSGVRVSPSRARRGSIDSSNAIIRTRIRRRNSGSSSSSGGGGSGGGSGGNSANSTSKRRVHRRYKKKACHPSRKTISPPLHHWCHKRRFANVVVDVDQILAHAARRVA